MFAPPTSIYTHDPGLNDKKPFSLSLGHTQVLAKSVHLSVCMSNFWFYINLSILSYPKANLLKFIQKVRDHKRKVNFRIGLNTFCCWIMPVFTLSSSRGCTTIRYNVNSLSELYGRDYGTLCIMKRKFEQWWLSIPQATKRRSTSHLNWIHWTQKRLNCNVGNPGPALGQA